MRIVTRSTSVIASIALSCSSIVCFSHAFVAVRSGGHVLYQQSSSAHDRKLALSKGFGNASGGGSSPKPNQKTKKAVMKQVEKKYGGTSAQDVAIGTQKEIEKSMNELPSHWRLATQLYQSLQQWDARMASLSIFQQANIPPQELEGAQRARQELQRLYQEHGITEIDIHNILQKITWDASADAKAARALTGTMPKDIADRVQKACDIIAQAVGQDGRCLDVGCGFGVLVPFLKRSGIAYKQIVGVDLSSNMIRNAKEQHPGVQFETCDFLSYSDPTGYEGIIFCASLHDMPDLRVVLIKASSLLRPGGKLVLAHPQGASHVLNQSRANTVLVKRGLPSAEELPTLTPDLRLVIRPASAGSTDEAQLGYLAVLEKSI